MTSLRFLKTKNQPILKKKKNFHYEKVLVKIKLSTSAFTVSWNTLVGPNAIFHKKRKRRSNSLSTCCLSFFFVISYFALLHLRQTYHRCICYQVCNRQHYRHYACNTQHTQFLVVFSVVSRYHLNHYHRFSVLQLWAYSFALRYKTAKYAANGGNNDTNVDYLLMMLMQDKICARTLDKMTKTVTMTATWLNACAK